MMMNRDKMRFWVRFVAIFLSAIFLGSFIFMGIGTNVSYNLFELIGNGNDGQAEQTQSTDDLIQDAEKDLEEEPNNPTRIRALASLYYQAGRFDDAARVLEEGREKAPEDEEIPLLLGQVYLQQASTSPEKEQQELYEKAGDTFATATELEEDNEDAYLLAGQAYDQAGNTSEAIKYYNAYLDREPNGEQAEAVKDQISTLLEGGEETTASGS
jgi:cytochrome c-type biogenesis protein CcmH/NrfG